MKTIPETRPFADGCFFFPTATHSFHIPGPQLRVMSAGTTRTARIRRVAVATVWLVMPSVSSAYVSASSSPEDLAILVAAMMAAIVMRWFR